MQFVARVFAGIFVAACAGSATAADASEAIGEGLTTSADRLPWGRFQGRVAFAAEAPEWRSALGGNRGAGLKVSGLTLMGDVYFASPVAGGGFRASSGVILGGRSGLWGAAADAAASSVVSVDRRVFGQGVPVSVRAPDGSTESGTLPYLGIGYSNLATGGWRFSADLGLVSYSPGSAVRLGRAFGGGQSLDDVVRDMRLAPVVQFGVGYTF